MQRTTGVALVKRALGFVEQQWPDMARAHMCVPLETYRSEELAACERELFESSPQALALSQQAVWGALEHGYTDAMERGWDLLRSHWSHPDFREGPRAFAEGRTPRWISAPQTADERTGGDDEGDPS